MPGINLTVRNLSIAYGRVQAIEEVTFSVDSGQFFTILGPSGSGKSTILLAVAGLLSDVRGCVVAGEILFDGRDISAVPPNRRVAPMVFQEYALFPHLNCGAEYSVSIACGKKGPRVCA